MAKPLFGPGGNSDCFYAAGFKSTFQAPEFVKNFGLDAYEVEAGRGVMGSADTYKKIGEAAAQNGISLSIHAPYFISLSSVEEEKRKGSSKYILQSAKALSSMGGGLMVIHAGSTAKLERSVALEYAVGALSYALQQLQDAGLYGVKLGIETMGKVNQLGTLDEVLAMCAVDKTVVPVVDFGHMNARECGGVFSVADDYKRVFEKISSVCGAHVAENLHCHFSKIEYTLGGEKKHLTFEDEKFGPDPAPLMQAMASLGVS
ncbi:MAG: TIM barrel protein, partial [Clostridia bacterium]|nr:TIM barrel protein [Clostridia bacterium]